MSLKSKLFVYGIPCVAMFMVGLTLHNFSTLPVHKKLEPSSPPASTQLARRIAGVGVVEPKSELYALGTNIAGIVSSVGVTPRIKVKKGDVLFTISNTQTNAELMVALAKQESSRIAVEEASAQLKFYEGIEQTKAISKEELSIKQFALLKAQSAYLEAQAMVDLLRTTLDRLEVTAPIDGEILRVNIRPGEFAPTGVNQNPLLVIGDTSVMHVRVEIDEIDVQRLKPQLAASGSLRSAGDKTVPLTFVRMEPLVGAKNILKGDGKELVDTRVMEVIYAFPNEFLGAFVGQQMDVYIDAGWMTQVGAAHE